MKRRIYLASSWRNPLQPQAVQMLRDAGHEVYDFRNPPSGSPGFAWSPIDPDWLQWTPERFVQELSNPIALQGFKYDKEGLDWCDTCVLLLPCGKSAHLEAGYAIGQGKPTLVVLHTDRFEPELMYLLAGSHACVVPDISEMLAGLDAMRRAVAVEDARLQKMVEWLADMHIRRAANGVQWYGPTVDREMYVLMYQSRDEAVGALIEAARRAVEDAPAGA